VRGPCAARAKQGGLHPTLLDEETGDEQEGVARQHRELDGQDHYAAAADQQRGVRRLEDLIEVGRDLEVRCVAQLVVEPALEGGGVAPHPVDVIDGQV
jgi:hypothetical protein